MAYVSQEMKAARASQIRDLLKKFGLKGSLSVKNHSTLCLTVTAGSIDFFEQINNHNRKIAEREGRSHYQVNDYADVNVYHVDSVYQGKAKEFLSKAVAALKGSDYYDKSDIQTDYFDTSHYVSIKIGKWNKPYQLIV